jgi:hypothetical protein
MHWNWIVIEDENENIKEQLKRYREVEYCDCLLDGKECFCNDYTLWNYYDIENEAKIKDIDFDLKCYGLVYQDKFYVRKIERKYFPEGDKVIDIENHTEYLTELLKTLDENTMVYYINFHC